MIDNFNILSNFIKPNDELLTEDNFYFLQIIRRAKDNPAYSSKTIRDFYIKNSQDLLMLKDTIIEQCNFFNARAYFNPNVKSYEKCANLMLKNFADVYSNKDFKSIRGMFTSAAGQVATRDASFNKIWIVDYDFDDNVGEDLKLYFHRFGIDYSLIPTKNGIHFLVNPFRTDTCPFADKIQKHNPTLLYVKE